MVPPALRVQAWEAGVHSGRLHPPALLLFSSCEVERQAFGGAGGGKQDRL